MKYLMLKFKRNLCHWNILHWKPSIWMYVVCFLPCQKLNSKLSFLGFTNSKIQYSKKCIKDAEIGLGKFRYWISSWKILNLTSGLQSLNGINQTFVQSGYSLSVTWSKTEKFRSANGNGICEPEQFEFAQLEITQEFQRGKLKPYQFGQMVFKVKYFSATL